jgi:hypothetical protein
MPGVVLMPGDSPDILWLDKGPPDAVYHLGSGQRVFSMARQLGWLGKAEHLGGTFASAPHNLKSIGASSTTRLGGTRRTEANHGRASE